MTAGTGSTGEGNRVGRDVLHAERIDPSAAETASNRKTLMNRRALVATHHKTGTIWMSATFRHICRKLEIPFLNAARTPKSEIRRTTAPAVIFNGNGFNGHSRLLEDPEARIVHLIRDPRDVVISGMRFHLEAEEHWLQYPKEKFGGISYQAKLNSLPNDTERFLLEIENANTIDQMRDWNYQLGNSFECRYEDLIADVDGNMFAAIAEHLGFSGHEMDVSRHCFWRHHIFGGMREDEIHRKIHIRSGEARQWPKVFDRRVGEAFMCRHGETLVKLGYETDDSWIGMLPKEIQSKKLDNQLPASRGWHALLLRAWSRFGIAAPLR